MRKPETFKVKYPGMGTKHIAQVSNECFDFDERDARVAIIGGFDLRAREAKQLRAWLDKAIAWMEEK